MSSPASASLSESNRIELLIFKFYVKSVQLILDSRIPHPIPHRNSPCDPPPSRRVRWFNLIAGEHASVVETLHFWNRGTATSSEPMVVDILLSDGSSDSDSTLERWIIEYKRSNNNSGGRLRGGGSLRGNQYVMYKNAVVLFRSMYALLRLLPAYKAFRTLTPSNRNHRFYLDYKISSFEDPLPKEASEMNQQHHRFTPVDTPLGKMYVTVTYSSSLGKEFYLEVGSPSIHPTIIPNYVGSPAIDPIRNFSASLREACFPFKDSNQSEQSIFRRHSTMKIRGLEEGPLGIFYRDKNLPTHRLPGTSSSCSFSGRTKNKDAFGEHKVSPSFSLSSTPSPSMCATDSPLQGRIQFENKPVRIPTGRTEALPAPSTRTTSESPSKGRSRRKRESCPTAEGFTLTKGHHSFGISFSSYSPRVGNQRRPFQMSALQDTADDPGIFLPFILDDIEPSDSQNRNVEGKGVGSSQPFIASEDAAVGALVQVLRSAPTLRQDAAGISSQTTKISDALEELRCLRDLLISDGGIRTLDSTKKSQVTCKTSQP